MKKNQLKISFALLLTLFATACNDEFLERYPLDRITNQNFWKTENDLAVYNNSLYNFLLDDVNIPILQAHDEGTGSNTASIWYQDEFGDNMASGIPGIPASSKYGRESILSLQVISGLATTAGILSEPST